MIPVFKPFYDGKELEALKPIFESGWIGLGPKTKEFEDKFASFIGVKHAIGVNSCTAALHLALLLLDLEDAEVITTPMTFISTNHAILYNKAKPVFADIEPDTLNIDPAWIEKSITKKTKAIVVVHYGGHACQMDKIMEIAKKNKLYVVEDVAHGCGGSFDNKKLGSIGDLGCFSFHAVKNLATGDGGMITLNNDKWAKRLQGLRWLGIDKDTWSRNEIDKKYSWYYTVEEIGFKCHMNDIMAVLGLVQLSKLEWSNKRRREISETYNKEFSKLSWLETPVQKPKVESANHNYVVKLAMNKRDAFTQYLAEKGISTSVHYFPNHLYDIYKPFYRKLPVAESVWKTIVTLPFYPGMSETDVSLVIDAVKTFKI
ncbi:MAG: DegT/DnrJ/EryC1/StrS family aminotransferase [Elusimicrobia bacterium]|nr:DegT/DnrJ/EryC1/StrS family aminotransferase [Elusimicrobiota bacterium]MBU2614761.1 DegT/DnrJ/EryC1/StrS family aminotransferase [Elusimicrobiota bacterium]